MDFWHNGNREAFGEFPVDLLQLQQFYPCFPGSIPDDVTDDNDDDDEDSDAGDDYGNM